MASSTKTTGRRSRGWTTPLSRRRGGSPGITSRAVAVDGGDLHRVRVVQAGGLDIDREKRAVGEQAPGPVGGLLALTRPTCVVLPWAIEQCDAALTPVG
ncbi:MULTISPECIES: hypothetical protein [Streptomyces]|uniref:Uncharacterized protein n=1 Tax=Streptomyces canarius TaxID=285453 RepID=A0ABQ3D5R4_9ACTN|nr:hypothetical protein [Streptomyces canarius]GHA51609.1 hypothetical protein GCM10010345_65190 [Streptomyces canarius]